MATSTTLRDYPQRAARWLRVDAVRVVRVEPVGGHPVPVELGLALEAGLERWRRAVARRRALVLVRRYALGAFALALSIEAALALTGGGSRSPLLLLAPSIAAVVGCALAVRRVT